MERLIKSIPRKEQIQIIVVDDNSTEKGLQKLINQYDYVEFYYNEEKKNSAGSCRNIGIKYAIGKWVLFADADDFFTEDFWEKIVPFLDSDLDIVFFSPTSIVNENGKLGKRHLSYEDFIRKYKDDPCEKNELVLRYKFVSPCSKLIKRSLIVENQIEFEGTRYSNDVMFSMKTAVNAKKIRVTLDTIYVITEMQGTLTTTITRESFMQRLEVFIRRYEFLKNKLSKEQFKILNLNGTKQVHNIVKYKLGVRIFFECIRKLRKHKVPVINPKFFNIVLVIKRIMRKG